MKLSRRSTSVSDRTLSRLLRLGVLVLTIGVLAFAGIYYQDQHVDATPSLISRQTQTAEQAVRKAPGNLGARLALATAYQANQRMDDALKQYDEILKVDGGNRAALLGRGGVLMAKGDLTAAAASYQKIVGKAAPGEFAGNDPQLAQAYFSLGQIALKQGRAKDAVSSLESAVKIDPGDADAWYALGTANLKAGAPERAVEALRTALKFVPTGWCEPYTALNQVYQKLGRTSEAEYAGAMVDFCQKRPADAKRRLQTLTSGPTAVDAMLGLGMIAETESDRQSATRWYQKVLAADPKNFNASTGLTRLGAGKTG
ncbi:MAG: tetratricopeptide repeat protein [Dermatophilaceae bacterium]